MVGMRMGERDHAGFTPTELSGDVAGGPARAAVEEDPVHEVGVDGVDRESVQPPYAGGNCFQGGAIRLRESPGPPLDDDWGQVELGVHFPSLSSTASRFARCRIVQFREDERRAELAEDLIAFRRACGAC